MTKVRLPFPLTQKAFILHSLLNRKSISEQDFKMNSFRARISDLIKDNGVNVKNKWVPFINIFGHKSQYKEHYLEKAEEKNAIAVYNIINNK